MQCSGCYNSKLQRIRNSPEGRLKRKHTITDAVQLWKPAKHRAEHSQGDLGWGCHLRWPTPIRLPSSEPELLWGNRKSGLDRESSMGQRSAIHHHRPPPNSSPLTWPLDIQQTTDGGFVLVGYAGGPSGNYNPWIAKLTSTGQLEWTHVFAGPNNEYGYGVSVRQTSDGGFIVGGDANYVVSSSYTESEITVFKLDSTGALVWQRDYAAGTGVYFDSLAVTSDGGFIVSGSVDQQQTPTSYTSSVLLLKLDSTGNTQFARTILPSGSISDLNIAGAQQTSDGGYVFVGYYFQNTIYTERAWLVKTDSAGNVQWDKIYGPDVQYTDRYFHSFQQSSDGGFIVAGSTNQFNGGDNSIWLVKTDSNGNISNCADVHNDSAVTGSIAVTVSNGDLSAVKDAFSYVADRLILSNGPLAATKECD